MKKTFLSILLLALHLFHGCTENNRQPIDFFQSPQPVSQIGFDDEIEKPGTYPSIWTFCLDEQGYAYVSDKINLRVDKFDSQGNYLFSFGGSEHESAKYPGWIDRITVNSKGNLLGFSTARPKFLLFSNDGREVETFDFNDDWDEWHLKKMKFAKAGRLFLLGHSDKYGYQLLEYDLETGRYTVFHTDNKRIRPWFKDLLPDFDIDGNGNIYIADTIEYKIFKYSRTGELLETFFKETKKHKIEEKDFNFLSRPDRIEKLPDYRELWKKLTGASGFFPAVFGLNISGGRIYLWTSNQDAAKKYLVDVYDLEFKYLCTTSYYNVLGNNLAIIKNNRLYIPDIGTNNDELKASAGRFSYFNVPCKIEVFQISVTVHSSQ